MITSLSRHCRLISLLAILHADGMPRFLEAVSCCEDAEVQTSVIQMLNACVTQAKLFCNSPPELFEGVAKYTPHPLQKFFNTVRETIQTLIEDVNMGWTKSASLQDRAHFLLSLLLPRSNELKMEVDFHKHVLTSVQTTNHWNCDSCGKSCTPATFPRYRCAQCDFDVCGDCHVYSPPDFPVDLISSEEFLSLVSLTSNLEINKATPRQAQLVCMLLSVARAISPEGLMVSDSFKLFVEGLFASSRLIIDMHSRLLIRGFVMNPLICKKMRQSIFEICTSFISKHELSNYNCTLLIFILRQQQFSILHLKGSYAWSPIDFKLLIRSLVVLLQTTQHASERPGRLLGKAGIIFGLLVNCISLLINRLVDSTWKDSLWSSDGDSSILPDITYLLTAFSRWKIEENSDGPKPESSRGLRKFPGVSTFYGPSIIGPSSQLNFDDWDMVPDIPAPTTQAFPSWIPNATVGSQLQSAANQRPKPAGDTGDDSSSVMMELVHAIWHLSSKIGILQETLNVSMRCLSSSSINTGNSHLLVFVELLVDRSNDLASAFISHKSGGLAYFVRQLGAVLQSRSSSSVRPPVVQTNSAVINTPLNGKQFLTLLLALCRRISASVRRSGSEASSFSPGFDLTDLLELSRIIAALADEYPQETSSVAAVIVRMSPNVRDNLTNILAVRPFTHGKIKVLESVISSTPGNSDDSAPFYVVLLDKLVKADSLQDPNAGTVLDLISAQITSMSTLGSSTIVARQIASCVSTVISFVKNKPFDKDQLQFTSEDFQKIWGRQNVTKGQATTAPVTGDRIELKNDWRIPRTAANLSKLEKGAQGTVQKDGSIRFDQIPTKVRILIDLLII